MSDGDPDGERTAHDEPHEPTAPLAPVRRGDSESRTTADAAPRVGDVPPPARIDARAARRGPALGDDARPEPGRAPPEPRGLPAALPGPRAAGARVPVDPDEETAFAAPLVEMSFGIVAHDRDGRARALAIADAQTAIDHDLDGLDTLTGHPPAARASASPPELTGARVAAEVRAALQRAAARPTELASATRIPLEATDRAPIIVAERTDPEAAPWSPAVRSGVDTPLPLASREPAIPTALTGAPGIAAMVTVPEQASAHATSSPAQPAQAQAAQAQAAQAQAAQAQAAPAHVHAAHGRAAASPSRTAPRAVPPADDTAPMRVPAAASRASDPPRTIPAAMPTAPLPAPERRRWDPVTVAAAVMVALAVLLVLAVRFIR